MKMLALPLTILGSMLALCLLAEPAQAQATRTWVSGVGDDANPCSRTAPCKTFAGAISKTLAGGIINCLDPGGFGAVTITKSITIDCEGQFAGVLASGTNGITVSAAAGDIVTLRRLSIEGSPGTGLIGINFVKGGVLHVEYCKIFSFRSGSAIGIKFAPPAGTVAELYVSDTVIDDNGTSATNGGIVIQPTGAAAVANVFLNRVQLKNNSAGIRADGTGSTGALVMVVNDSLISGNANNGITVISPAGGSTIVGLITATTIAGNSGIGLNVSGAAPTGTGSATVRIGTSSVHGNATGVSATGTGPGVLRSYKNNFINTNNTDGTPITPVNQE